MAEAVVYGTYSDLKMIKTRSVVQLVVEVPIERAKQVTDAFGWPQPGSEIPVAVARMNAKPAEPKDTSYSTRAVMLCKDVGFQKWVSSIGYLGVEFPATEEGAREYILRRGGIDSRAELNDLDRLGARDTFERLQTEYHEATRTPERR